MTRKLPSALLLLSLALALVTVPSAFAAPASVQVAATLGVSLSFSPNPVSQNSQTQILVSISGGAPPYWLWFNSSIPGCQPSGQPFQQNTTSSSYPCMPSAAGTFTAHLDAADRAGDYGSTSGSLTVQSSGGGGSNTGNGTNPFDLAGLQNLLPIVLTVTIVLLASAVASAASLVALAILVPRRLKQLRKAIQGEPLKKVKAEEPQAEAPKVEGRQDDP